MSHDTSLIGTVVMGLVLAFAFGFVASRLRLPPLVGYLLAGIAIGPYTPGFVADASLAGQLAEIGVILLMFGVGLHFSVADLMAVRWIAIPGAVGQIAVATAIGAAIAVSWGWTVGAGIVLGLSLSVASTVVLLRALEQRNAVDSPDGRIAVGWLIVEDLAMVLALVLLPALAGIMDTGEGAAPSSGLDFLLTLGLTLGKVAAFVALTLTFGPRLVPWVLGHVARTGSRELFTLSVLAVALGIALGSAELFGVSFALGAFFAGVVLSESDLSQQAAADSLPLQDAFAVLFFVSVGMLFDPSVLLREPLEVLAVVLVIIVGKSLVAFGIVLLLGLPVATAMIVSASLAQIGEFSFILAALGIALGILPVEGRDLLLAGAIVSIALNPLLFSLVDPAIARLRDNRRFAGLFSDARERRLDVQERELAEAALRAAPPEDIGIDADGLGERFPMFADLTGEQRQELIGAFRPRSALPGERIIRVGDDGDAAFFISGGKVEVSVGGRHIPLGPGDFFGEMALLTGEPRTADVTALDYTQLLTLDRAAFEQFLAKHPTVKARVDAVAAERLEMNRVPAETDDLAEASD